jgi:hypothetical protein
MCAQRGQSEQFVVVRRALGAEYGEKFTRRRGERGEAKIRGKTGCILPRRNARNMKTAGGVLDRIDGIDGIGTELWN